MKKSGFAKGVFWTLSIGIILVVVLIAGALMWYSYAPPIEASYSSDGKSREAKIKIAKKDSEQSVEENNQIEIAKIQNNKIKSYEDIINNLKVEGEPFSLFLGDLKTGEKNISVTIKKRKTTMTGLLDSVAWDTKFSYLTKKIKTKDGKTIGGERQTYTKTEFENFPTFKIERVLRTLGQVSKFTNLPKETKMYKRTNSNSVTANLIIYTSREYIEYGEDSGYLNWHNLVLEGTIKEKTIVEAIGTKQGNIKKIIRGLCKNPNELFKAMYKKYVNNCDMAFLDAINDHNMLVDAHFDNNLNKNLQQKLLASINNQKKNYH